MTEVTLERAQVIAKDWADWMDVTTPFEVQVGAFDGLPPEIREMATGDEFAATFGAPDCSAFILCISDKCPPDKLEHVIVHELVHIHTFSQSGPDERAAMEVATELAAQLVMQLREREPEADSSECEYSRTSCDAVGTFLCVNCDPDHIAVCPDARTR